MDHLLASSSSSSSSSVLLAHHDVFLSFRGKDTRKNFIGHLYRALQQKGIQTFIDNKELKRGEEISPSLIKAIRGSKISIIIFSKNYASSSWCLDELVEILRCRESLGQLVWPVFLDVDPSDARNHKGSFGKALAQYKNSSKKEKEKLPNWKLALIKASNLSGWHLADGDESQLIQKMVEAALSKLNRKPLDVAKYPVGIKKRLEHLESLIDVANQHVKFIGLYGMGGIGKTTIAKAVYNRFADEFEGSSFLDNVRETSKQHLGFVQLQEALLFDVLGDKNLKVGNIHRGINIIKERLCNKRVLLILDDVDELDQLETLAGGHEWFGFGSRIVITTRNKHLLTSHGVNGIDEVQGLDHETAPELLSWHAFKREKPPEDYLALSDRAARYADGIPLALVVLGSLLCGRTEEQWQSALHNLEKKPHKKLYEILKISFDALQDNEKSLFLDIACFFVGEDKDYVVRVLGSGNFCPIIGVQVLTDMSLISVQDRRLRMHHLIEEVGKEIVCQESPEAGERSRLWSSDDIFHVFSQNTATNTIEGIMLKLPEQRTLYLNATSFEKMKRLRLLIFANVVLSTAIGYLSTELRLIDFPGYRFPTLPFNSGPKQLVILNMPHNHIHQLDEGFENFESLKVLNLSYSTFLRKIPDLSTAPNLERLHVDHCRRLTDIHESVGFLTKLVILDAQHCRRLRTVPSNLFSKYFTRLDFQGCSRLQVFPNIVEKIKCITSLNLSGTGINELPSSIDHIVALRELHLSDCRKLVHIPSSIYKLLFLDVLDLNRCTSFSEFPNYVQEIHGDFVLSKLNLQNCNISKEDFLGTPFSFPLLQCLDLSGNKFATLRSARKAYKLSDLSLANCKLLREIPELPDRQINLKASACESLVETTWNMMTKIISIDTEFLRDSDVEVTLSGSDIPDLFSHKSIMESVNFDVPQNMSKKMAAVIICAVSRSMRKQIMEMSFELLQESDSCVGSLRRGNILIEPGNMWLIYLPASTLLSECLPYSPFKDTKASVLNKINLVNKIKVSFLGRRKKLDYNDDREVPISICCGIHVLWDQDELMIKQKPIKVSDPISHIVERTFNDFVNEDFQFSWSSRQKRADVSVRNDMVEIEDLEEEEEAANISETEDNIDRTFDDFANEGNQFSWSSQQKRASVSARTNIFEIDLEEKEKVTNISETADVEVEVTSSEKLANIFETEGMEEDEEPANISETKDMEELTTKKKSFCCIC